MGNLLASPHEPLLRIPPFPGSAPAPLGRATQRQTEIAEAEVDQALRTLTRSKVAGQFWGERPALPGSPYVLIKVGEKRARSDILKSLAGHLAMICTDDVGSTSKRAVDPVICVSTNCDPWHLVSGAVRVIADADDELLLIAALAGLPVQPVGPGRFGELGDGRGALRTAIRDHVIGGTAYCDPFTGQAISVEEAVALCVFWKRLIDSNRPFVAALGIAAWKRTTAAPLLWAGAADHLFVSRAANVEAGNEVVVWKSRTDPANLAELERQGAKVVEAEDGFIRSIGLGADCVPPLSLVVDRLGIYFDPSQPSELENLLQDGEFTPELVQRASRLRTLIVDLGVSKYAVGQAKTARQLARRRCVLVPGQVEDDRSVQCGGGAVTSNLELLRRARQQAPDAHIMYKPHPDVEAGHRVGAIAKRVALNYADELVANQSISSLIDLADEVHVNTSLAGFEALMRGKPVTTHGVPFYAGWGLTRDLGSVPERRTAKRTLDELVAAVLLQYPRYLDPASGLPCTAETLILRLAESGRQAPPGLLVRLRRLQGSWRRRVTSLRGLR